MLEAALRLRHELHRHPELSGQERETVRRIVQFFSRLHPDTVIEHLGGHGVAIVFSGKEAGPTVLLRCELDALPIEETIKADYRSLHGGVSHKCGHDGHMAILAAVGMSLAQKRPRCGKVVLLFQPAEETGEGAMAVVQDPKFAEIRPHYCFAVHNLPGFPLGQVVIREGTFACASRGMTVRLYGTASHAGQPDLGRSPTTAMCQIIEGLTRLPMGTRPDGETAFVTIVGAALGQKSFGITPDKAEIWATLRSESDDTMLRIVGRAEQFVQESASGSSLRAEIEYQDIFPATLNASTAVELVHSAVGANALETLDKPFRWSEDFGRFTALCHGALIGIGAGKEVPDLHKPEYDFPDSLVPLAAKLLVRIVHTCLG
nr:amidohydrolase [uncultured Desulfobulbus sp.]